MSSFRDMIEAVDKMDRNKVLNEGSTRRTIADEIEIIQDVLDDFVNAARGDNGSNDKEYPEAQNLVDDIRKVSAALRSLGKYDGELWFRRF